MDNPHLQRALLLFNQKRWDLAEQECRQALGQDPNNARLHGLLARCLSERNLYREATEAAQHSIHLAPDDPFTHASLAEVLVERKRYQEAESAIGEAIALDQYESHYFALLASIRFALRRWQPALEAAEEGLARDPEDAGCANLRAMALVKLGRPDAAGAAIDTALRQNPEDAVTHANQGWTLIEQGDHKKAMEHFREALRLDPDLEWARQGIVEALRARYFIYRIMLKYFLWMMKLSKQAQWGVVIGGYIGYRFLNQIARNNPDLAPYIQPLLILYITFAVMTWISAPLFNLLLRLNRFGRLALSREQIITSNWVGLLLLGALAFLGAYFATGNNGALYGALACGLTVPPLATIYHCDKGWPRVTIILVTLSVFTLGTLAAAGLIAKPLLDEKTGALVEALGAMCGLAFIVAALGAQFAANWLASVTVRR